jgi:transcriptional regulator with XRE-family HTH domain
MIAGDIIRKLRNDRNWTQDQLAEKSGLSRPTISMIESGRNAEISSLQAIATALNISFKDLTGQAPGDAEDFFLQWAKTNYQRGSDEKKKIIEEAVRVLYPGTVGDEYLEKIKKS